MKKPTFCGASADETPTEVEKRDFAKILLPQVVNAFLPRFPGILVLPGNMWENLVEATGKASITKGNECRKNSQIPGCFSRSNKKRINLKETQKNAKIMGKEERWSTVAYCLIVAISSAKIRTCSALSPVVSNCCIDCAFSFPKR